jgi:hypothetical protein
MPSGALDRPETPRSPCSRGERQYCGNERNSPLRDMKECMKGGGRRCIDGIGLRPLASLGPSGHPSLGLQDVCRVSNPYAYCDASWLRHYEPIRIPLGGASCSPDMEQNLLEWSAGYDLQCPSDLSVQHVL